MIKAIIFDFDGVLVESVNVKTRAFAKMFEDKGEEVVRQVTSFHLKNGGMTRDKKIMFYYNEILKCPLSDEKLEELCDTFSRLVVDEVIRSPYVEGAKEFLEKFYSEIDFYVASGTPEQELREIVKRRGMSLFFKGVFGSPAQKGEIAKMILKQNGYNSKEVVYVGDSIADLRGAIESGTRFIGRLDDSGHDPFTDNDVNVVKDMTEIEGIIRGL
jgi:phosphoglycolate phosphatase-like HAD superfamily hydrolase